MMLTPDDVFRARATIAPHLAPTPLRRTYAAGSAAAYLKLECWQPTGSFKVRGALNVLANLSPERRARGIVAASAGNHALGVAHAVQALGGAWDATVIVPTTAPRAKIAKLRRYPVTVREHGATYDDAHAAAEAHVKATGATYVHAYDDVFTASGQGTIGLEILEALPDVGTIVVPVGGGGMISGIATVAKQRDPTIRMVAVQVAASPSLRESLRRGVALLEYAAGPTLADGLAGGIGAFVWEHRALIDDVVEVDEEAIEDAIVALLSEEQIVAEGSAAAGVAALRTGRVRTEDGRPAAVVVTGGNIDASVLRQLLAARA